MGLDVKKQSRTLMRLNIRHLLFIDWGIFYYLALSGKGSQSCLEKGKGPEILLMLIIFHS